MTLARTPIAEQIALLDQMVGELQAECQRAERHHVGTRDMRELRWRRLRTLRDARMSVHRWRQVMLLRRDLAEFAALKAAPFEQTGDDLGEVGTH